MGIPTNHVAENMGYSLSSGIKFGRSASESRATSRSKAGDARGRGEAAMRIGIEDETDATTRAIMRPPDGLVSCAVSRRSPRGRPISAESRFRASCDLTVLGRLSADDVDQAIDALTNHVRTVVENSSRVVLANSHRKELPKDVSELIRAKNTALRRASKYPTCENRLELGYLKAPCSHPCCTRSTTDVQLALFADDTALFLRSNNLRNILPRFHRAIDKLTQWLRFWRIELIVSTVSCEPPAPYHFCRRPRNILSDPPDDITVEVEKIIEANKMAID
ncbi:hypothetical protein EVAR_92607_1 [Eumeta japonica]|uniref:RNA-directed DNA polymerase from mobile element jockey n=1 Tax=Eumeta variegata TaxID=151549 RepID=A0A4C1SWL5_EUMVA|nr:hypothetical protein EVAR_92607_1 [Eumeta japonica]